MLKKNSFKILFIGLALGQICSAKPTNEAKDQTTSLNEWCQNKTTFSDLLHCEEDNQKLPSLQLLKFTVSGLVDILVFTTEKAKSVIDQILCDQELLQIAHNDEVKTFIEKLKNAQEICQNCRCFKRMERMLDLFLTECANYYKQAELDKLSLDGKQILIVIEKYDVKKLLDDYDTDVNKFIEQFDDKYKNLKDTIKEEDNKIEEKLNNWYEEFKTIKGDAIYGKKIKSFRKLFNIYREELLENTTTTI